MPDALNWQSSEGQETLKTIVAQRMPQLPTGLYNYQTKIVLWVLDRQDLLWITATGDGKSMAYTVPILVHQELSQNPDRYPAFRACKFPVGVVVTPTKGLSQSITKSLERFGIAGFSYTHENITAYRKNHVNLSKLICECKTWQVICVDPEHLGESEWRNTIFQSTTFKENLVYFCAEEVHLIRTWGRSFRPAFSYIGATARGVLPDGVPIIALTATLPPGPSTKAICESLGLLNDHFHLERRSNERRNIQVVIEPLERRQGVPKYTQILQYLRGGRKTLIHVSTIPEVYDIYWYLWQMQPSNSHHLRRVRMYHSLCTDVYNNETFELIDSDPYLQVVICTAGFTQGVDRKEIQDNISYGTPRTIDQLSQQMGRGGRKQGTISRGIALIPSVAFKAAREHMDANRPPVHPTPMNLKAKKKKKATEEDTMEEGILNLLVEENCYIRAMNIYYGNTSNETGELDCHDASREIYCGLCAARHSKMYDFAPIVYPPGFIQPPAWLTDPIALPNAQNSRKSKTNLGKKEREEERKWLIDFRIYVASKSDPNNIAFSYWPTARFFPEQIITDILDQFFLIDSLERICLILRKHQWPFTDEYAQMLYNLLVSFQEFVNQIRAEEKQARLEKRQGRQMAKERVVVKGVDDEENTDGDGEDENVEDTDKDDHRTQVRPGDGNHVMNKSSLPAGTTTRAPRAKLQGMRDALADMGPQKTVRRR
ncbi:P-loop containing nucleoside triphosphate hydrolase protein [Lentinula edodes]|nr:P-loop containing nucleoside triphosphate hydrolase protein [Lentinula edodes]